jgi:hypothetical protein
MTFAIAYTVNTENIVLSGLDSQGVADAIIYSSQYGPVTNVTISTY